MRSSDVCGAAKAMRVPGVAEDGAAALSCARTLLGAAVADAFGSTKRGAAARRGEITRSARDASTGAGALRREAVVCATTEVLALEVLALL